MWKWKWSRSVVSDSWQPHGLSPTRLLCPWDSLGKSTGVGCHFLLQGIFLTQGWNLYLLHFLRWQAVSLPLAPPGKTFRWIVSFIFILGMLHSMQDLSSPIRDWTRPPHWQCRIWTTEPPSKCQWSALDEDYRWELKAHFSLTAM